MRIISGKYRGKKITPPKNFPSRPTTDSAKEGLFNILENRVEWDALEVLDLFAGTGNISSEFLSRGAKKVFSVDLHPGSVKHMFKVKTELDDDNWMINRMDVFKFLLKNPFKFDLIFADPPFGLKGVDTLPDLIFKKDVLNEEGILIIEHGRETDYSSHQKFKELRNYGGVHFSFFY